MTPISRGFGGRRRDDVDPLRIDHENAPGFAAFGCPVFACTPEQFPSLMAAAIEDATSTSGPPAKESPEREPDRE